MPEAAVERIQERFAQDPTDRRAFETLEEHHFLRGEWTRLTSLYRRRLRAEDVRHDDAARAALLVRLGGALARESAQLDEAVACYREALQCVPGFPAALRQLREVYTASCQWELVLQVAEAELAGPRSNSERARLHLECGSIWRDHLGDPNQALVHFQLAAADDPQNANAAGQLARSLEAGERFEEAADAWGTLAELVRGRDRVEALTTRAKLLEDSLGRYVEAGDCYRKALTEEPENLDVLRALTPIAAATGQWTLVAELQERWFALEPEAAVRGELAVEAARSALEAGGDAAHTSLWLRRAHELQDDAHTVSPAELFAMARAAADAARRDAQPRFAAELFELALEIEPGHPDCLASLGEALYERGDVEGAASVLQQRLALDEPDPERLLHLNICAAALETRGEFDQALSLQREILKIDPLLETAHSAVARLLCKAGEFGQAADRLASQAERSESREERAQRLFDAAEVALRSRTDRERGLEWLRQAVEVEPRHSASWVRLASELYELGRQEQALDATEQALSYGPSNEDRCRLLVVRAVLLEEAGRVRLAAEAYARAADADPSGSEAVLCSSRLFSASGNWRAAADVVDRFLHSDNTAAPEECARCWCALARLRAGPLEDIEGAIECYQRAVEVDPETRATREVLADLLACRSRHRKEALKLHAGLLAEEPTRIASLRAVTAIAKRTRRRRMAKVGCAILVALRAASEAEARHAAPNIPRRMRAGSPRLEDVDGDLTVALEQLVGEEPTDALESDWVVRVAESEAANALLRRVVSKFVESV